MGVKGLKRYYVLKIPEDVGKNILEEYNEFKGYIRISKKYGIPRRRVKKFLEENGINVTKEAKDHTWKIGKKFGKLKVLSLFEKSVRYVGLPSRNHLFASCECECGRRVEFRASSITGKRNHTCRVCSRAYGNKVYKVFQSYKEINSYFWGRLVNQRNRKWGRTLEFSITQEYIWSILEKQDFKCALTGQKLKIPKRNCDGNASVDRIDSTKGYIEGNIQWVTAEINKMKLHYTQERFIELCKLVVKEDKRKRRKPKNEKSKKRDY